MTIQQLFEQFIKEFEIDYRYGFASDNHTITANFYISNEDKNYETKCFFIEEEGIFVVTVDLNIPSELINFDVINGLNALTKFGSFIYDELDDKVYLRISQFLRGEDDIKYESLKDIILMAGLITNEGIQEF